MIQSQRHSFHLVDPSPWPISGSLGVLATTVGGVMYMHSFQGGATLLSLGLIFILYTMFVWWRDVLRESTLEGHHTKAVQLGLRYGFILFIVSEVMFFFAFFWAFSHSSLAPVVEIIGKLFFIIAPCDAGGPVMGVSLEQIVPVRERLTFYFQSLNIYDFPPRDDFISFTLHRLDVRPGTSRTRLRALQQITEALILERGNGPPPYSWARGILHLERRMEAWEDLSP